MSRAMQCQSCLPWGSWAQLPRSLAGSRGARSVSVRAAAVPGELGSVPLAPGKPVPVGHPSPAGQRWGTPQRGVKPVGWVGLAGLERAIPDHVHASFPQVLQAGASSGRSFAQATSPCPGTVSVTRLGLCHSTWVSELAALAPGTLLCFHLETHPDPPPCLL